MSLVKAFLLTAVAASYQAGPTPEVPSVEVPPVQQTGVASWYGDGKFHGDITANGEEFDPYEYTCAHRSLPFNTVILVENRSNGRRAWCRVNDRGPYIAEHTDGNWTVTTRRPDGEDWRWRGIIDLSIATARKLHMQQSGLRSVHLRYWRQNPAPFFNLAVLQP
jgi:rare lipoprotein A (peptidoglycan hydrolase)